MVGYKMRHSDPFHLKRTFFKASKNSPFERGVLTHAGRYCRVSLAREAARKTRRFCKRMIKRHNLILELTKLPKCCIRNYKQIIRYTRNLILHPKAEPPGISLIPSPRSSGGRHSAITRRWRDKLSCYAGITECRVCHPI